MSVEEFLGQPGETYHDFHELWDGQIIEVPAPSERHMLLQEQIVQLLERKLPGFSVRAEFYITLPEEARRIDVGALRRSRFGRSEKPFFGSPELVIEVLSESNTVMDLDRLREKCFQHGCIQFWVLNREFRTITIYQSGRAVHVYSEVDTISIKNLHDEEGGPVSGDDIVAVKDIFSVLDAA